MAAKSAENPVGRITSFERSQACEKPNGEVTMMAMARIELPVTALESFVFRLSVTFDELHNVRQNTLKPGQSGELTSPLDIPANGPGSEVRCVLSAEGTTTGNTILLDQKTVQVPAEVAAGS
jgi:hypothetical protein